jgi:hypothetical protein
MKKEEKNYEINYVTYNYRREEVFKTKAPDPEEAEKKLRKTVGAIYYMWQINEITTKGKKKVFPLDK